MILKTFIPSLALVLSAGTSLMGQATKPGDIDFSFKPRYGFTFGNVKTDLGMDQTIGLGIEGRRALTSNSWAIGELVYSYYGGKEYDNTNLTGPIYGPNGTGFSTNNGATPPVTYTLDPTSSIDSRKNSMAGVSLRLGYEATFATDWSWQAGISLDMLRYTQEVSGTLVPVGAPEGYYEGLSVTPHKASLGIGAFAGIKYAITPDFSLDINATSMGYTTQNYEPTTYTGMAPSVTSQSRHGFGLEFAFGLKL